MRDHVASLTYAIISRNELLRKYVNPRNPQSVSALQRRPRSVFSLTSVFLASFVFFHVAFLVGPSVPRSRGTTGPSLMGFRVCAGQSIECSLML